MQGNDISLFTPLSQICMFEGVLAHRPTKGVSGMRARAARFSGNVSKDIESFIPNEIPMKSLADAVNRRQVGVEVVTLMGDEAAQEIEHWLLKRGVSNFVVGHSSLSKLAESLKFHHPSIAIHVATQEQADYLGIRARVADPGGKAIV